MVAISGLATLICHDFIVLAILAPETHIDSLLEELAAICKSEITNSLSRQHTTTYTVDSAL